MVPIQDFSVSIHKTRGSEWSNRAYKGCLEHRCGRFYTRLYGKTNELARTGVGAMAFGLVPRLSKQ